MEITFNDIKKQEAIGIAKKKIAENSNLDEDWRSYNDEMNKTGEMDKEFGGEYRKFKHREDVISDID